jgi:hypothetical protein
VVVQIVADDLDARELERREIASQDVEVPAHCGIGLEMNARLDSRAAGALRAQPVLDGSQDLVVRERESFDVGAAEEGKLARLHAAE